MPVAVEKALRKSFRKKGKKGKALESAVYGTMTNMQKKGEIPAWRSLKKKKMGKKMGRKI